MRDKLVIIPCGKKKIWADGVTKGSVEARQAYTGTMFRLGMIYAEVCEADCIVLSAKYGYVLPHAQIEEYDVTFSRKASNPISYKELADQLIRFEIWNYKEIVGLGGADYRKAIIDSFACNGRTDIRTPFAGLSMGNYLHALKEAIKIEIIESVSRRYDDLDYKSLEIDEHGKITFLRNCWWVPTIEGAFSGWLEGPGPTKQEREWAYFRINEERQILLDLGPSPGAWDQFHVVMPLVGKRVLVDMGENFCGEEAYLLEAKFIGLHLKRSDDGFLQCYLYLSDILKRDSDRPAFCMYDSSLALIKVSDEVSMLNFVNLFKLSVLEEQA